jgi:hypothetical protein
MYQPLTMLEQLREDRPSRGGDQQSFLDQGIASVRFIETVESPNSGGRNIRHRRRSADVRRPTTRHASRRW